MNSIVNLKTMNLQSPDGPVAAIVMGLSIPDLGSADSFIEQAAKQFKQQRMCSPLETSVLLITIMGTMTTTTFVEKWTEIATRDQVLKAFMSKMRKAEVVLGTDKGEKIETASLI